MLTEKIGPYLLYIQGMKNARTSDSEEVLQTLRRLYSGVDLQLLRADRVAGKEHLKFAAMNAIESYQGKGRRAKHLSMEFLLFASGKHQIVEAIKLLGLSRRCENLVFAALSTRELDTRSLTSNVARIVEGEPDDTVIEINTESKKDVLKRVFGISEKEIDSSRMNGEDENSVLKRLVIERSALLVLQN